MSKPTIAIFGSNGTLGAPVIAAFEGPIFKDKFQSPISVYTRDTSSKADTNIVKYIAGDLVGNANAIAEQLRGTDVIISLSGWDPELIKGIEKVVTIVNPKVYIPSQFGANVQNVQHIFPGFLLEKTEHSKRMRENGIKVVDIFTFMFVGGPWVYEINAHFGLDTANKSVTYLGSPDQKTSFSNLNDIGRAVASVATSNLATIPDELRIRSGTVSPAEVVKLWESRHDAKLEVKAIIPKEQALKEAEKDWKANGFQPSKFMYYLNVLVSQADDNGFHVSENENEIVNPNESLWKWEKF